jgi:hypothetical protein
MFAVIKKYALRYRIFRTKLLLAKKRIAIILAGQEIKTGPRCLFSQAVSTTRLHLLVLFLSVSDEYRT